MSAFPSFASKGSLLTRQAGGGSVSDPSMPGGSLSLEDLLTQQSKTTPSTTNPTGLNYTPAGTGGFNAGGAIGGTGIPRWFAPNKTQVPQPGINATDAASTAALSDLQRTQAAADKQHQTVSDAIAKVQQTVAKSSGQITAGGAAASDVLKQSSIANTGKLEKLGDSQVSDMKQQIAALKASVDKNNAATISNFKDMTAQEASVTARGIAANYQQTIKMATKGIGADGLPMSPEEQQQAIFQAHQAAGEQTQAALTGIYSNFNNVQAQLRTTLSAQSLQAGLGGLSALGEAQGGQRSLYSQSANLGATLDQARAQIANATPFAALQLEMQGQTAIADMNRQNPQSVVSYFSTVAALTSLASAPNVGNIRFDFSNSVLRKDT